MPAGVGFLCDKVSVLDATLTEGVKDKVKCTLVQAPRLCTGRTAHRGSRRIALLFLDHDTKRGWAVSSTPRPHFTPGKDPVPILLEAGWAPRPVWTGGKSRPHWNSIPDRPARGSVAIPNELPGTHLVKVDK